MKEKTKKHPFLVVQPSEHRSARANFTDTRRRVIFDEKMPEISMFVGESEILTRGKKISMHYHPFNEEFQFILSGTGVVRDAQGIEYPLEPGTSIYCGVGPGSAHEFENTSDSPLVILCVFISKSGKTPEQNLVNK